MGEEMNNPSSESERDGYSSDSEQYEESEPTARDEDRQSGKFFKLAGITAAVLVLAFGAYGFWFHEGSYEIPKQYRDQIVFLRDQNIENAKAVQDLQRQIAKLNAESVFNAERIDTLAQQAVNGLGIDSGAYRVNLTSMKIERTSK